MQFCVPVCLLGLRAVQEEEKKIKETGCNWSRDAHPPIQAEVGPLLSLQMCKIMKLLFVRLSKVSAQTLQRAT